MKRFSLVLLALAFVLGLALVGCKGDSEPTYTVWATTMPYTTFTAMYGATMNDNSYFQAELSTADFNQYKSFLQDSWKHDWTENQIYTWFLESTFTQAGSRTLATWLITVDHGSIALRRGSLVYAIAK